MTERVVVLTGATDGLGRALAGRLATEPGTRLILHGRSVDRLAALRAELVGQSARVETVQADMAELVQVRRLADDLTLAHGYSGQRAYGQSKLALIAYGFALADRLDPAKITVNSLHPATYMPTKMVLDSVGHSIDTLDAGVLSTLRLVRDRALGGVTGRFYDRTAESRALPEAYDSGVQQRLLRVSEELTGV